MISLYVLCKCRGWERLRKGPWRDRYPITVAKSAEKWKMGIKLISSIPTNSCASCIARGLRSLNFNNFFFNCKILTHQFKVSLILVGLLWHHVHHVCITCASCVHHVLWSFEKLNSAKEKDFRAHMYERLLTDCQTYTFQWRCRWIPLRTETRWSPSSAPPGRTHKLINTLYLAHSWHMAQPPAQKH